MIIDEQLVKLMQPDKSGKTSATISAYTPTPEEAKRRMEIVDTFRLADLAMRKPRREFNDMSVINRMMLDQMAFNTYQPNNGDAAEGDILNSWKSHAIRPVIRNKVVSIAAHATARLLFPKVFARNEQNDEQKEAATVMRDLIEYASEENDYARFSMYSTISALVNPVSIMHTEFCRAFRYVKRKKDNTGKWILEKEVDEENSGFQLTVVPVDEFFILDFYENDVQKQDKIIWRRVRPYSAMAGKYGGKKNFKHVRPGVQVIYNDANTSFYEVYDSNLRQDMCEEIIFYCKSLDLQIAMVNGVMMDDPDEPNPRMDKKHPFITFGYELFDEGKCFYYKSMAFKVQPDADIINTLYPLIIDGTYLNIMSPMIIAGEEKIGADVIIPGGTTQLSNPKSTITPLRVAQDINQGMLTLQKVEESVNQSTEQPAMTGKITAYQMSKIEQERQTILGLFVNMIASYVKQYGELIKSDVIQYLTLPEVDAIVGDSELIYKTFIVNNRKSGGKNVNRKIQFTTDLPELSTEEESLWNSYDILEEQGGDETDQEIYKVNPLIWKDLKYKTAVSPDVVNPMSDDLERTFGLELFDRAIQGPKLGVPVDMEQIFKDFLFDLYPKSKQDTSKYFKKPEIMNNDLSNAMNPNAQPAGAQPADANPQAGTNSPLASAGAPAPSNSPMAAMMNNPLANK